MDYVEAARAVQAAFWGGFWSGGVAGAGALYAGAVLVRWWRDRP